jgi:large subunit ribosomal protein L31
MKTWIHPAAHKITATCTCGAKFEISSTLDSMKVESCSNCHNFYTWKEKAVANSWQVAKFRKRQEALAAKAAA